MAKHDHIHIDGAMGEGGGQILRSALALSMISGRPFRIERIRANRPKPGLMRQHLTAVQAAAAVSGAQVVGAEVGSETVEFVPGAVRPGTYAFSIGTAGSTTLVLQTVLPALIIAEGPSRLVIEGGTHNHAAPTVRFLQRAFLPVLERMGPRVSVAVEKHGFYPAGGGRIAIEIEPSARLVPLQLVDRGEITARRAIATVAGLPGDIAKRELGEIAQRLGWTDDQLRIEQLPDREGPGNIVSIEVESAALVEVFTGFGRRGVSAEHVGLDVAKQAGAYLAQPAPVWHHLADQLLVPMAVAGAGVIRTCPLSNHGRTNLAVIEAFLPSRIVERRDADGTALVEIIAATDRGSTDP